MLNVSRPFALFRFIRWVDVMILEGVPILGLALSVGGSMAAEPTRCLAFAFAVFLLLAHVFTLNDWADFTRGVHHSSPAMLQLERQNATPRQLLIFSFVLLAASAGILLFLSERSLILAAAVAALGIFYSHPSLNAKSMPIVSTLVHLVGGTLHFLVGYGLMLPIDSRGVLIGFFFGLTFAAGHPLQEVRDVSIDREVGARTNAVVFGTLGSFVASLILFTIQYAYLFWLAWSGLLTRWIAILPVVAWPIHLWWAINAYRAGLSAQSIEHFEIRYRVLYAVIGLAMLVSAFR